MLAKVQGFVQLCDKLA